MPNEVDNSALLALLGGIEDRRIRRKVKKLVDFGAEAVRSLGELDSAMYSRKNGKDQLQIISDAVLSHVRRLLGYLGAVAESPGRKDTEDDTEIEFAKGDSLDVTELATEVVAEQAKEKAGGDGISADSDQGKWLALASELDSMQYGLGSELREYDERFSKALLLDRKDQAHRDLNDATNSLMDGVFAMMTTVYELFLGHADPDKMIPGYRDTLGKALAVRRSLTELRREVQELNRGIQNSEGNQAVGEMSFNLLRESLLRFINDDEFSLLRPSDQNEFADFGDRLLQGSAEQSRMDCEGLDKYLDSLAVVSQRDVLLKHDLDLREKLFGELEEALALVGTEPERVKEVVEKSFLRAERLFGLIEELDSLVFSWSTLGSDKRDDLVEVLEMGHSLKGLIEPPRKTPAPVADGDFF